jgi:hypothetical protein
LCVLNSGHSRIAVHSFASLSPKQAIRKACEELSVTVQAMAMEMTEKIDRESVGFIVHEKYEEIVRYLQDALQSSLEDENRFKQKADEIQEMVILLTNSKADRTEIQHMQELMVKSEALLKKVGGQMNLKEKLKDLVSRKDLETILEMKVDKVEFEMQLQQVLANTKRNRKLTSMATTGAPVVDDAMDMLKLPGAINKKAVVGSASVRGARGGPESMSAEALMQQQLAMAEYGQYEGEDGPYQLPFGGAGDVHGADPDYARGGGSAGGGVGFTTEFPRIPNAGGPGYAGGNPNATGPNGRKLAPGEVPVMAIGRSMGNTSPGRGGISGGPGDGPAGVDSSGLGKSGPRGAVGGDFGAFARNKKNPVTSSSLPIPGAPGQFRSATEAGKAGGPGSTARSGPVPVPAYVDGAPTLTQQQWVAMGHELATYGAYIQQVASVNPSVAAALTLQMAQDPSWQQGAVPDHTSFLNGPVVGGGFNTHAKHLQHKMPGAKPVVDDDVEGKGL